MSLRFSAPPRFCWAEPADTPALRCASLRGVGNAWNVMRHVRSPWSEVAHPSNGGGVALGRESHRTVRFPPLSRGGNGVHFTRHQRLDSLRPPHLLPADLQDLARGCSRVQPANRGVSWSTGPGAHRRITRAFPPRSLRSLAAGRRWTVCDSSCASPPSHVSVGPCRRTPLRFAARRSGVSGTPGTLDAMERGFDRVPEPVGG